MDQETLARGVEAGYLCRALMSRHDFQIPVTFKHRIVFTRDAFAADNPELAKILSEGGGRRTLVLLENAVAGAWPRLEKDIRRYFKGKTPALIGIHFMPGGEAVKSDDVWVREIWRWIDAAHIDRHSYVIAIGGGAFLDAVGFATATAHRGIRLVRFPTTTLSQSDSGVGVKCAINGFGKKNWLGTFAVPYAVINDFRFLHSQSDEVRRVGLIEAIKVALVKDGEFFEWIETNSEALAAMEPAALETCVERSAMLHARHIAEGGDPFESGSSRPLDFGHWAAHKLEALSSYKLPHDRAVAVGLALDTLYSVQTRLAPSSLAKRVFPVLRTLQLPIYHPGLDWRNHNDGRLVLEGLDEFREHLGGELTVLMLKDLGQGVDAHQIDPVIVGKCIDELRGLSHAWA